jgi:photosystem II stability/assembly factor-like uncharacterized protein
MVYYRIFMYLPLFLKKQSLILISALLLLSFSFLLHPQVASASGNFTLIEQPNSSNVNGWCWIEASADALDLIALECGSNYIYISHDGGVNWDRAEDPGAGSWKSVEISDDGNIMVAARNTYPSIYLSTDSGETWDVQSNSPQSPYYLGITADASKMAVTGFEESQHRLYVSLNQGVDWARAEMPTDAVASSTRFAITYSDDGSLLVVADYSINGVTLGGYIYLSTDDGQTWATSTGAGRRKWYALASSEDGSKLAAIEDHGYVYLSDDSGVTWATSTELGQRSWLSIDVSDDGNKIAACQYPEDDYDNEYVFTSIDGGSSWVAEDDPGEIGCGSVALSSDGSRLVAVDEGYKFDYDHAFIYTTPITLEEEEEEEVAPPEPERRRRSSRRRVTQTSQTTDTVTTAFVNNSTTNITSPSVSENSLTNSVARDLTVGISGQDVVTLQGLLIEKGFLKMPLGVAEGYFGNLTKAALAQYQRAHGIAPAVGYFGTITRAFVKANEGIDVR